MFKFNNKGIHK